MKICMFTSIFPPRIGGPATQTWHLCKSLRERNLDPIVVTISDKSKVEYMNGIKVYRVKESFHMGILDRLIRIAFFIITQTIIFKREKIKILHCHDAHIYSLLAGFLAKMMRVPCVVKYAGDMVWETLNAKQILAKDFETAYTFNFFSRIMTKVQRFGLNMFDVVWATSQSRKESLMNGLNIDEGKIRVIPNFIRLMNIDSPQKRDDNKVYIITAGRFAKHKRLDILLRAFSMVNQENVYLRLVGGGESWEVEVVNNYIDKLDLGEKVHLLGRVDYDVLMELFLNSDIYLSTSLEEGFGIVFVEAMACGLPIVCTKVGGVPEVVPDGKAGYVVEPDDLPGIVEKLRLLSVDSKLRREMGNFGIEYAKRFDLNRNVAAFIDLYNEILTRSRR